MKKLFKALSALVFIVLLIAVGFCACRDQKALVLKDNVYVDIDPNGIIKIEPTFEDLLDAIEWVESKGDANAVGDNGNAVGAYQIWKIYVRDVNRIDGRGIFEYDDRWSKKISRRMVEIYINWYASRAWDLTYDTAKYFEYAARCHNGGPNGWKKESTKPYWLKVKARMEIEK
jgi:hypothetical protein